MLASFVISPGILRKTRRRLAMEKKKKEREIRRSIEET